VFTSIHQCFPSKSIESSSYPYSYFFTICNFQKSPVIVLVVAVPNVEWTNVDCSCTYQQTSCNRECCDFTRWIYPCATM